MSGEITSGSRISDLIHVLSDPIEYMGGVVSNFALYGYDRETSAIWIGVTGMGAFSNYKLEEPSIPVTVILLSRFQPDRYERSRLGISCGYASVRTIYRH